MNDKFLIIAGIIFVICSGVALFMNDTNALIYSMGMLIVTRIIDIRKV